MRAGQSRRFRFALQSNPLGGHHPKEIRLINVRSNELAYNRAIPEHRCPICYTDQFRDSMRDERNATARVPSLFDFGVETSGGVQVKSRRGFIENQQSRIGEQCAHNHNPLLHTEG